ncbi:MAG TPA: hypothetical protein VGQ00_04245 [Candidatus Norongarragalinales archaeon]|jgi:hypothetical protein|nr:hypothetical protein [Candidatus Norongarragalinales archaeon]
MTIETNSFYLLFLLGMVALAVASVFVILLNSNSLRAFLRSSKGLSGKASPDGISNSTILVVILAALLLSAVGTLVALSKPTTTLLGISGAVVGNATFNVTSISSIKFFNATFGTINFGNINVTDCSPWFVAGTNATPPCYNNTEDDNPNPFVIENDGGNKVNVTMAASSMSLTGTGSQYALKTGNQSCYHAPNTPRGACNGQAAPSTGGVRAPAEAFSFFNSTFQNNNSFSLNAFQNVTGSNSLNHSLFVSFLNFTDSNDTVLIDWAVNVAADESAGFHNSTLTLTAVSSGTGP